MRLLRLFCSAPTGLARAEPWHLELRDYMQKFVTAVSNAQKVVAALEPRPTGSGVQ